MSTEGVMIDRTASTRDQRRVFKYPLAQWLTHDYIRISMPAKSKVLHVGHQDHVPTIWFEVSLRQQDEDRFFTVHGTGHHIDDNDIWLGSYIDRTRHAFVHDYVWHVYERKMVAGTGLEPVTSEV